MASTSSVAIESLRLPKEQRYEYVQDQMMLLIGRPVSLWWLSFVDPDRSAPPGQQVPGGGGFLGVAICEGDTLADAITRSHLLGVNPGGQVSARGPLPAWMIAPEWRDRLLTKEQALSIPDPTGGSDD